MLADLQSFIANIYDADCGHRLHDFLITDRALATVLGRKTLPGNIEETVLVADDEDGIAVSVFLDEALLARLDDADPLNELQAEVDKFVTTSMLARQQGDFCLLRNLHRLLFDEIDYEPTLNRKQRERYELANSYAARFCRRLLERVSRDPGNEQLREFYRLT